ncbi:hypothetical protein FNV43_RR13248 [Rhamnella rubrinervis]|uniref:NB-ARC domain-containing protein n=1 Tax=Rhamnella rubrinervis TaxID=2594499 RepID=A0A8K0H0Q5_9ROSA|nr:hypothetical protein FNV43_RR13248 [Rhamnella rubrinervis]
MGIEKKVHLMPLSESESWELFVDRFGAGMKVDSDINWIAKSLVEECGGLPLMITSVADHMKGMSDARDWYDVEDEVKRANSGEFESFLANVYKILRGSYENLPDFTAQKCFLYCAMYPQSSKINREELIEKLIINKFVGKETWDEAYRRGHRTLQILEKHCLLEFSEGEHGNRLLSVNKVIRNLASVIINEHPEFVRLPIREKTDITQTKDLLRDYPEFVIFTRTEIADFPKKEHWSQDLSRVSLTTNNVISSPLCEVLSLTNLQTFIGQFDDIEEMMEFVRSWKVGMMYRVELKLHFYSAVVKICENHEESNRLPTPGSVSSLMEFPTGKFQKLKTLSLSLFGLLPNLKTLSVEICDMVQVVHEEETSSTIAPKLEKVFGVWIERKPTEELDRLRSMLMWEKFLWERRSRVMDDGSQVSD